MSSDAKDASALRAVCPGCEPDNPAARYADTCLIHRVRENLPAHYSADDVERLVSSRQEQAS